MYTCVVYRYRSISLLKICLCFLPVLHTQFLLFTFLNYYLFAFVYRIILHRIGHNLCVCACVSSAYYLRLHCLFVFIADVFCLYIPHLFSRLQLIRSVRNCDITVCLMYATCFIFFFGTIFIHGAKMNLFGLVTNVVLCDRFILNGFLFVSAYRNSSYLNFVRWSKWETTIRDCNQLVVFFFLFFYSNFVNAQFAFPFSWMHVQFVFPMLFSNWN